MNNTKSRVFMKVEKTSCNASYDFVASYPIQLYTLDWIYIVKGHVIKINYNEYNFEIKVEVKSYQK